MPGSFHTETRALNFGCFVVRSRVDSLVAREACLASSSETARGDDDVVACFQSPEWRPYAPRWKHGIEHADNLVEVAFSVVIG